MVMVLKTRVKISDKVLIQTILDKVDRGLHVYGDGPVYQVKMDIWVIAKVEIAEGNVIFSSAKNNQTANWRRLAYDIRKAYPMKMRTIKTPVFD